MGMITVIVEGSFRHGERKGFSAMEYGHAKAVADAIKYLADMVLPSAIQLDHELAAEGERPRSGFGLPSPSESRAKPADPGTGKERDDAE